MNLQRHMRCHLKESLPFRTKQEVVLEPDADETPAEDLDPGFELSVCNSALERKIGFLMKDDLALWSFDILRMYAFWVT